MRSTVSIAREDEPFTEGLRVAYKFSDKAMKDTSILVDVFTEDVPTLVKVYVAYKKLLAEQSKVVQMFTDKERRA